MEIQIEDLKKGIVEDVTKVFDEKVKDIEKKFITMDEFRKQMEDLQKRLEKAKAQREDKRLLFADYLSKIVKGEGVTGAPSGSSLVPQEVADFILVELQNEWIMQDTTVFPSNKGILFYAGDTVSAARVAVGTAATAVDQQVNAITYATERLVVGQPVGKKLLEEANPKVVDFLINMFRRAFANRLVYEYIQGTGTGENTGLDTYTGITTVTLDATETAITDITYDDIADVYFSVPAEYRDRATWYMHTSVLKVIKKLKDTNGLPIFDATDKTIFGRPVREVSDMPTSGATRPVIYFGYAKDYFIFHDGKYELDIVEKDLEMVQKGQVYVQLTGYFDGKLVTESHFAALKLAAA